jgi:formate/nitrite transporter FocA (FNT family)
LGYSLGFLLVILGRQQLFTENTLTSILPLLQHPTFPTLGKALRLWGIVLVANLRGHYSSRWWLRTLPLLRPK